MKKTILVLLIAAFTVSTTSFAVSGLRPANRVKNHKVDESPSACPNHCGGQVFYNRSTSEFQCAVCGCKWKIGPGPYIIITDPGNPTIQPTD